MKTILILRDRPSSPLRYLIDHYAIRWRYDGYRVIDHIGLKNIPDADIVIVHIDLTIIPQEYIDIIRKFPKVINGKILDVSRRQLSQLLLKKTDNYTGPVIIKTNANYGGLPEYSISKKKPPPKSPFLMNNWDAVEVLQPLAYPIFPNINNVPHDVWDNDNLIVERFIKNREKGLFYTHYYVFFGDKEIAGRLSSPNPIVKFGNSVSDIEVPVPDVVRQWRKELKIDFGRFDYIEAEGEYYLIDVNKTEGGGQENYEYQEDIDYLASGLDFYMR